MANLKIEWETDREPCQRQLLVPLPPDLGGVIASVACQTRRQADFLAALLAFAPQQLLDKATASAAD